MLQLLCTVAYIPYMIAAAAALCPFLSAIQHPKQGPEPQIDAARSASPSKATETLNGAPVI
jgi:hypothetical protein